MVTNAEIALNHAKRLGGDRQEVFRPILRPLDKNIVDLEAICAKRSRRKRWCLLPADHPIGRPGGCRLRSAGTLEPRQARQDFTFGIHSRRRAVRSHQRTRHLHARQGCTAAGVLATRVPDAAASVRFGESLVASTVETDLINDVKAVLSRTSLAPGTLKLELTESLVMSNRNIPPRCSSAFAGWGQACPSTTSARPFIVVLSAAFPVRHIKIDQSSSTERVFARPVLLRTIVAMGHDLGMSVVAEGRRARTTRWSSTSSACEYAQGFYFGEAVTAAEATKILRKMPAEAETA